MSFSFYRFIRAVSCIAFIAISTLTAFSQNSPENGKRNARPQARPVIEAETKPDKGIRYIYQFSQPDFTISSVKIQHDDNGVGTITFEKQQAEEPITDPLIVSANVLEQIKAAFASSRFLESTEDYQHEKHSFPHLGTSSITLKDGQKERTVNLNWTDNKFIDAIIKDYRRLSNQYVWMFDINLARENQPLEAPKIVERLDSLLRRKEIADPEQLLPFLDQMIIDERLPLLARNHTAKIAAQIRKKIK